MGKFVPSAEFKTLPFLHRAFYCWYASYDDKWFRSPDPRWYWDNDVEWMRFLKTFGIAAAVMGMLFIVIGLLIGLWLLSPTLAMVIHSILAVAALVSWQVVKRVP